MNDALLTEDYLSEEDGIDLLESDFYAPDTDDDQGEIDDVDDFAFECEEVEILV